MALSGRFVISILCVYALLFSVKAVATDDAYLKMLEGEAEGVSLDQTGQLKDTTHMKEVSKADIIKKDWAWEGDLDGDVLPSGLAQNEFATVLKQNYYGSFVFFRKLNSIDQETVYNHYQKAQPANLEVIRQDILNHLKR